MFPEHNSDRTLDGTFSYLRALVGQLQYYIVMTLFHVLTDYIADVDRSQRESSAQSAKIITMFKFTLNHNGHYDR